MPRMRGRKCTANLNAASDEPRVSPARSGDLNGAVKTTEDPYVQATLKRSIVELYNTCHRLLSFKVNTPGAGTGGLAGCILVKPTFPGWKMDGSMMDKVDCGTTLFSSSFL